MSLSPDYKAPKLPDNLIHEITRGVPLTKSRIKCLFINIPQELHDYKVWAEFFSDLIEDYAILRDIDIVAKELLINTNNTIEKTNFLFQQVQDSELKYFAEQIELLNLSFKLPEVVFNDETIQKLLKDQKKFPLVQKIIQKASHEVFINLLEKKDKISEETLSLIINTLSNEQLGLCINKKPYAIMPNLFQNDLPFFLALTKTLTGQAIIIEKLLGTKDSFKSLIEMHTDLIKPIVSLLPHLNNKFVYELFIAVNSLGETALFDLNIFSETIPLLFSKLNADDLVEVLTVKSFCNNTFLLSHPKHLEILLKIPSFTEKFHPNHLQSLFLWPEKNTLLRNALLSGFLTKEILMKLTGQDFDVQSISGENTSENHIPKEKIRCSLFSWAIKKPSNERREAIKFSLLMGCINEFSGYLATLSETEQSVFLKELGTNIVSHALFSFDDNGNNLCEKNIEQAIPLMDILLTQEGGAKQINTLLTQVNSEKITLIGGKFAQLVPFFNKILKKENGFKLLKEILFSANAINYITRINQIEPFSQLELTEEQLTILLSTINGRGRTVFGSLIIIPGSHLIWEKLDTSHILKLLAVPTNEKSYLQPETVLHTIPNAVIPILQKVLKDKKNGIFAEIKKLLLTVDSEGSKPVEKNLSVYVPVLREILQEEGGPEFVRSLITHSSVTQFYERLNSFETDASTKKTFLFFDEAGFSSKEIMNLLFSDTFPSLPRRHIPLCIAALPLLEKLAVNEEAKKNLREYFIPENSFYTSIFWDPNFLQEALPLLIKLGPNAHSEVNAVRLLSEGSNFINILKHLGVRKRLSEISPLIPYLSSDLIIRLISRERNSKISQIFNHTSELSQAIDMLNPHLEPQHLAELLLLDISSFRMMLTYGYLKKNILVKAFGIDFDSTVLHKGPEIHFEEDLQKAITRWIQSKNEESEKAKCLILPYLLNFTYIFQEEYKKLSVEGLRELHAIMPKAAIVKLLVAPYQIRSQHMQEGISFKETVPEPVAMETITFIDQKDNNYPEFYSFLPNLINGVAEEVRNAHIQFESYLKLVEMERIIRTNEHVYGLPQDEEQRKKEYQNFCSFLTHIVRAYKLGQEGGDLDDKIMVCDAIGDASKVCFPGWMKEIIQLYSCIKTNDFFVMPTIRDRLLARLQTERIYILTMKMPMEGENIHEPNYLQDLFREDLNTGLDPINDIQNDQYKRYYQKNKTRLRTEFDEYYSKEYILTIIADHINDQHKRTKESKHFQDLPPAQVTDWIRAHIASKWKQEEYDGIPARVLKMQAVGVSLQEIDKFLNTYGIVRQKEETVAEATRKLENEIQRYSQNVTMRTFSNLSNEVDEIFSGKDKTKWIEKKKSFIARHPNIKVNEYSSEEQFKKAISDWNKEQKNIRIGLETIKKEIDGSSNKLEVLKKHGRIRPAQPLDEVLQTSKIKEAQIAQFFDDVVYREIPDPKHPGNMVTVFTPEAGALLLEFMGVFK